MSGHASVLKRNPKQQKQKTGSTIPYRHSAVKSPNSRTVTTPIATARESYVGAQPSQDRVILESLQQFSKHRDFSQIPIAMGGGAAQPFAQLMSSRRVDVLQRSWDMGLLNPEGPEAPDFGSEEEEEDDEFEIVYDESAPLLDEEEDKSESLTKKVKKFFLDLWEKIKPLKDAIMSFAKRAMKIKKYGDKIMSRAKEIFFKGWEWANEIGKWAAIVEPSQVLKVVNTVSGVLQKLAYYGELARLAWTDKQLWGQTELLLAEYDAEEKKSIWAKAKGYISKAKDAAEEYAKEQIKPKTKKGKVKQARSILKATIKMADYAQKLNVI